MSLGRSDTAPAKVAAAAAAVVVAVSAAVKAAGPDAPHPVVC